MSDLVVSWDPSSDVVHVRWGQGMTWTLHPGGAVVPSWCDPGGVVELVSADDESVVAAMLELIADVRLAAPARRALASALGVDPSAVGRAAR